MRRWHLHLWFHCHHGSICRRPRTADVPTATCFSRPRSSGKVSVLSQWPHRHSLWHGGASRCLGTRHRRAHSARSGIDFLVTNAAQSALPGGYPWLHHPGALRGRSFGLRRPQRAQGLIGRLLQWRKVCRLHVDTLHTFWPRNGEGSILLRLRLGSDPIWILAERTEGRQPGLFAGMGQKID